MEKSSPIELVIDRYYAVIEKREIIYPSLFATMAGFAVLLFNVSIAECADTESGILLASAISFAAIVVGFTSTSVSVLILSNHPIVEQLKVSEFQSRHTYKYIVHTVASALVLVVVSVVMLLLDRKGQIETAIWCFIFVLCLSFIWRLVSLITKTYRKTPKITY